MKKLILVAVIFIAASAYGMNQSGEGSVPFGRTRLPRDPQPFSMKSCCGCLGMVAGGCAVIALDAYRDGMEMISKFVYYGGTRAPRREHRD